MTAWPELPEPIRAGILALVRASHAPAPAPEAARLSPRNTQAPRRSGGRRSRQGGGG